MDGGLQRGSKEWALEASGLGFKLQIRGVLVPLWVLEGVRRGPEKAVRGTETLKNLEKLDI